MHTKKIASFLWFRANAEGAVSFYASVFGANCQVSGASFELFGQRFIAFEGGPHYELTPAFSIMVDCDDQTEIDPRRRPGSPADAHGSSYFVLWMFCKPERICASEGAALDDLSSGGRA